MLKISVTSALFACEFLILAKAFSSIATNMRGWTGTSTSSIRKGLETNHKLLPHYKIDTQRRSESNLNSVMKEEITEPSVSVASKSNLFCTAAFRSRTDTDNYNSGSGKVESQLGPSLASKVSTTEHVKRDKQIKSLMALANILEETHNPVARQDNVNMTIVSDTTTSNTDDNQKNEFVIDSFEEITYLVDDVERLNGTTHIDDTQRKDEFIVDTVENITTPVDEPVLLREFRQESGIQIRRRELIESGKNSNDQGERAFAMLLELNIVEINLDPDDPLYDHEFDSLYSPDNNWLA
mmetsp:Transcript_2682/g.3926  ORF Transcript_2682/g.3926 Transcript_2682/m.3926 type:complete len:296 (-) Transcript_2682:74-961(-)